jgi:hypothetical protein
MDVCVQMPNFATHYNPFVIDAENIVYNVRAPTAWRGISHTNSVWMRADGTLVHMIENAEDARVFKLNGRRHALFIRYRAHRRKDVRKRCSLVLPSPIMQRRCQMAV